MTPKVPESLLLQALAQPALWRHWPMLPVKRYSVKAPDPDGLGELGVVYDALGHKGVAGYSATVWLFNLWLPPTSFAEMKKMPHYTYDTFDELVADGWVLD